MKRLTTICAALLTATLLLFAASEGPNSAGAGATDGGAGIPWTDPGNITSSNGARATAPLGAVGLSEGLEATTFGFALPAGTVDGIEAAVERSKTDGTGVCEDATIQLIIGGSPTGDDKSIAGAWPGTDASQAYGGTSDLWGLTPTVAQVNATNFGLDVSATETGGVNSADCSVDHITMTVTFTVAVGGRRRFMSRNAGKIEPVHTGD